MRRGPSPLFPELSNRSQCPTRPKGFDHPADRRHPYDHASSQPSIAGIKRKFEDLSSVEFLTVQKPSNTSKSHREAGQMNYSPHPAPADSSQAATPSRSSSTLRSAIYNPPITRNSLSELDCDRFLNNLLLRHDLNFDTNIQFRPNTSSIPGRKRMIQIREYWEAIESEITIWLGHTGTTPVHFSSRFHCVSLPDASSSILSEDTSSRLPLMLETVSEVLKSFVPSEEWTAIEERLDIGLLIQQLGNGACDLTALGDSLAALLRRHCSSERNHMIDTMTSNIRLGVQRADAHVIACGLRYVFGILEAMKLVSKFVASIPRQRSLNIVQRILQIIRSDATSLQW